jgi:hypothetical protein
MKTLSMGAGVQTTALLFEFWQEEKWDYVVFADTGSERASTYKYLEDYIKPFCKIHGIKFVTVKSDEPLEDYLRRKKIIPQPHKRFCTDFSKIRPLRKFIKSIGATAKNPVEVHLGISLDEIGRVSGKKNRKYENIKYPLIDRKITRKECHDIIEKHGYPQPSKSGCDFCMFNSRKFFKELSISEPKRFKEIVSLEENSHSFKAKYYLHGKYPLRMLIEQQSLDNFGVSEDYSCDSGHCFT